MNKRIISIILVLIMLLIIPALTACNSQEEIPMENIQREKIVYALTMNFIFRMVIDGEATNVGMNTLLEITQPAFTDSFNPFYTDLIFVHNEAQALEFPDNVITAWPRDDGFTESLIDWINFHIKTPYASTLGVGWSLVELPPLEDFNLTYPITRDNLIYDWENVWDMWRAFDRIASMSRFIDFANARLPLSSPLEDNTPNPQPEDSPQGD